MQLPVQIMILLEFEFDLLKPQATVSSKLLSLMILAMLKTSHGVKKVQVFVERPRPILLVNGKPVEAMKIIKVLTIDAKLFVILVDKILVQ